MTGPAPHTESLYARDDASVAGRAYRKSASGACGLTDSLAGEGGREGASRSPTYSNSGAPRISTPDRASARDSASARSPALSEPRYELRPYFRRYRAPDPDSAESKLRLKIGRAKSAGYRRVVLTMNEAADVLADMEQRS